MNDRKRVRGLAQRLNAANAVVILTFCAPSLWAAEEPSAPAPPTTPVSGPLPSEPADTSGLAAPAEAETQAKALILQGRDKYLAGDYAAALDLFQRSHALYPRESLIFNIAQCQRRLGQCDEALEQYRKYAASTSPKLAMLEEAQYWVESLARDCAGAPGLESAVTPVAPIAGAVGPTEAPAPLLMLPSPLEPTASAAPLTASAPLSATGSVVSGESAPPPTAVADESYWTLTRIGGYTALAGLTTAVPAVYFAFKSQQLQSDYDRLAAELAMQDPTTSDPQGGDELVRLEERGQRANAWATGLGIAALGLTTAGLALFIIPQATAGRASGLEKTSHASTERLSLGVGERGEARATYARTF